jgi:hypothetical protein
MGLDRSGCIVANSDAVFFAVLLILALMMIIPIAGPPVAAACGLRGTPQWFAGAMLCLFMAFAAGILSQTMFAKSFDEAIHKDFPSFPSPFMIACAAFACGIPGCLMAAMFPPAKR